MPTSPTPFLWFDSQAEEAMRLYLSIFPDSREINVARAGDRVMSVEFELNGQRFMGLNAGPMYTFSEAVSFFIGCDTQEEIDAYWSQLTADGGEPGRCGWLKDRFGLSWQVVPKSLGRLLGDPDPEASKRVVAVMLQSSKLDIAALEAARLPA